MVGPGTTTITASAPADANFNAGTPVSQTLTVNAATAQAVISAFPNLTVPLQSVDLLLPATSTYSPATYVNNPIIYTITASSSPGIATIVNNRLHMLTAGGTVTIQATQPGNGKFPDAAPVTAVYTINPPNPLVFTTSLVGKTVGSADFDPAATYPASGAWNSTITYSLSPANAAVSIVENRLHFISTLAANTVTVNASITYPTAGGGTATLTTPNTTLSIVAATSTLAMSFTTIGTLAFSNVDYTPTVVSPVGTVPIVLTSSDNTIATIVNGNIHMVKPGTVKITATQQNTPANGTLAVATATLPADVQQTVTIGQPTLSFTTTAIASKVGPDIPISSLAIKASMTNVPYTVTSSNPSVLSVANGVIHYSGTTGNGANATITVSQGGLASGNTTSTPPLPPDAVTTYSNIAALSNTFAAIPAKQLSSTDYALVYTLSIPAATLPPTFTSSNPAVATIAANGTSVHFVSAPAPPNNTTTITLSQGGGPSGTAFLPADISQILTVTPPTISWPTIGTKSPSIDFSPGASSTFGSFVFYTSSNPAVATINNTLTFTGLVGGSGFANNATGTVVYNGVPLTGGTGGTSITSLALTNAGTGYTNGTYYAIPLTGGTGSGATATITVSGGVVTSVYSVAPGTGYTLGDVLSATAANLGGTGSGFSTTASTGSIASLTVVNGIVTAATITTSGTGYTSGDYLTCNPTAIGGTNTGAITSFPTFNAGSGYVSGAYYGVPLTGGTGTGATATITVAGGVVSAVTIVSAGTGYTFGDVLTTANTNLGGTGSGFNVKALTGFNINVSGYSSLVHFSPNIPAAPNNTTVITASQNGGATGTPTAAADVSQVMTVPAPAINFPALGTKQFTSVDLNPGATGIYTTGNSIASVGTLVGGTGYTPGTYYNVPLTGGNGTGAQATIVVTGGLTTSNPLVGVVSSVTVTNAGIGYTAGNVLTATTSNIGGTGSGFTINVATISAGYPVTYTSSNPAVATIVNNMIHFTGAPAAPNNTTVITASQTGPAGGNTGNLSLPPSVSQTLTVTPATITFGALGSKVFTNTDLNPGATSTVLNVPINYSSSNAAVATINNESVNGISIVTRGTGYTAGTYYNVPLTGGTGTGATAQVILGPVYETFSAVSATTTNYFIGIQSITIVSGGSGYTVGDVLTCSPSAIGGTGSGFSMTVTSTASLIHFVGVGTTNIVATQQNTPAGAALAGATLTLPADVQQTLTVVAPAITFPALSNITLPSADVNPGATSTYLGVPVTYSSSNTAVATINANSITNVGGGLIGTGYSTGTYTNVPLTYFSGTGTGSGALATITVSGGQVASTTITYGGSGYNVGDVLTTAATNIGGSTTSGTGFTVQVFSVGGVIHPIGAGTTTITATQGAATNPNAPADQTQSLTILPYNLSLPVLGAVTMSDVNINPGATSTLTTAAITYTSSNTNVATIIPNSVLSFSSVIAGSGYPSGNYYNVPLLYYSGTGTGSGILANVTVTNGGVSAATITNGGTNYVVGDILVIPQSAIGGVGTGAILVVGNVSGVIHLVSGGPVPPGTAVSVTIKASQQGSNATTNAPATATLPADVSQTLTVYYPTLSFAGTIGTKVYTTTDFNPLPSSTLTRTPITLTSSNPAVATIIPNEITGLNTPAAGLAYITGTYNNVPLTGGSGSGATASIVTANGSVTSVKIISAGTGYQAGDILSASSANLGGAGVNFSVSVASVASLIHYVAAGTTTITATQQGTLAGAAAAVATATLPADVQQTLTVVTPVIIFPTAATVSYTNIDAIPGASSPYSLAPITYTSSNPAVATIVNDLVLSTPINGGSGYTAGTYTNVPLTGGSGTGAVANITVSTNGFVTSVNITNNGTGYNSGDVLSAVSANIGGGAGFNVSVKGYVSLIHYNPTIQSAPANTTVIKASQGGGATGNGIIPADASETLTVLPPAITFPVLGTAGTLTFSNIDVVPGATSTLNLPITYTSSNTAVAYITASNQIRLVGAGTTVITASQTAAATTAGLPVPANAPQTITVSGTPAITVTTALGSQKLTNAPLNLNNYFSTNYPAVPITYTITSQTPANAATLSNGFLTMALQGTVTVTASQNTVQPNQPVIASVPSTLTITTPLITFAATNTLKISTADVAPGATSTVTNVPVTYTSSNPAIATIVNGNIHFTGGLGVVTITATQQGTPAGSAPAAATATLPADAQQTLTVTAPAITLGAPFNAAVSKPFGVVDLPLVATAGGAAATSTLSTLPITITSSDPNVATIVGGNIHYVGLGTCTINFSQAAAAIAAGYAPPIDQSFTLTVTAPTLTLTAATFGSKAFTTTDISLPPNTTSTLNDAATITYTSSDPTVAVILNNNAVHYVGLGTTLITATQASYLGSGTPLSSTAVLTVTPATITPPAASTKALSTADAAVSGFTATLSTTTYPLTYTSSNPNVATILTGTTLHLVGVGTTVITGYQTINATYAPAPTSFVLTVNNPITSPVINFTALGTVPYTNQGDITPTASSANTTAPFTFTSSNPAVATIVNGNIHLTPPTIVNGVVTYPNPNTTVITASQGGGIYGVPGVLPPDVSQVLTVLPAYISFPSLGTKQFTTVDLAPGAVCTYSVLNANNVAQPITYTTSDPTVATIVNGNIHFVGLGPVTITASIGGVIAPDVSSNMVVVAPVITFPALGSKAFSSSDVLPGASSTLTTVPITYSSSNTAVATIVNGNIHFVGIGTTTITASQVAVGNSTVPISVDQPLTVTVPTLAFSAAARTQQFTLTDQDLQNSSLGVGATSTLTTVPITYTSSNPALVTIVNGNKLHFVVPPSTGITDNVAIITATQAGANGIPTLTATQVLTVSQNVIMPPNLTKYYGDADFVPGYSIFGPGYPVTYTSGTVATATVVSTIVPNGGTIHIVAPGTSAINALQVGDASTAAVATGAATTTLTVLQAPMTITPKNITITYGTTAVPYLGLNYYGFKSASGAVPLDDSTKFSTQPTVNILGQSLNGNFSKLAAGTYTLTASGAVSTLYTFTYGTGTLTVLQATQMLTWNSPNAANTIMKTYGNADFDPLARSTGDPIVYTSSNPAVATIVNGKVHIIGAGSAVITATLNQTSGNFVNPTPGVPIVMSQNLVVSPASQTIAVATIPYLLRTGPDYTPTATASSGLPITSIITGDSSIVTPNGFNLHPKHVGASWVKFIQAGNANWLPDTSAAVYVNVIDPSGLPVTVHQAVSPNGDGINDFLYIEGIQAYMPNHVKIINRNGDNVYEADNYDNKNVMFTGKAKNGNNYLPAGTYFYIVDYYVGNVKNHNTGYFVLKY